MFKLAYKDVFDTYILHLGSKSPKHTPCSQLPAHSRIGISCCTVDLYLSSKTNILALFYIHLQTYPTCDPLLNMTCLLNYLNLSSGTEILLEYSAGKKKNMSMMFDSYQQDRKRLQKRREKWYNEGSVSFLWQSLCPVITGKCLLSFCYLPFLIPGSSYFTCERNEKDLIK